MTGSLMMFPMTWGSDIRLSEYVMWVKFFCTEGTETENNFNKNQRKLCWQDIKSQTPNICPFLCDLCLASDLQLYLKRLASAGDIFLFRYPGNVVHPAINDCFLSAAGCVWQVQWLQGYIVILEEILQGSDSYVVAAAQNCYPCICK